MQRAYLRGSWLALRTISNSRHQPKLARFDRNESADGTKLLLAHVPVTKGGATKEQDILSYLRIQELDSSYRGLDDQEVLDLERRDLFPDSPDPFLKAVHEAGSVAEILQLLNGDREQPLDWRRAVQVIVSLWDVKKITSTQHAYRSLDYFKHTASCIQVR